MNRMNQCYYASGQCNKQIRIISVFVHGYGPDMAISIQIRAGRIRETSRIKIREYGYAKSSKQIIFVGGVGSVFIGELTALVQ